VDVYHIGATVITLVLFRGTFTYFSVAFFWKLCKSLIWNLRHSAMERNKQNQKQ